VGSSNRQVVETVQKVTGKELDVRYGDRRPGDPAVAIASNEYAHDVLGWELEHSELEEIVRDAWHAHQSF
jgi:UDP-glucose 4-epimerase